MLDTERAFFDANLAEWLKTSERRVALIKDDRLIGFYDNERDAIAAGLRRFGGESFLARRVLPRQPVVHYHTNHVYALTAPALRDLIAKAEAGNVLAHHLATELSSQGFG